MRSFTSLQIWQVGLKSHVMFVVGNGFCLLKMYHICWNIVLNTRFFIHYICGFFFLSLWTVIPLTGIRSFPLFPLFLSHYSCSISERLERKLILTSGVNHMGCQRSYFPIRGKNWTTFLWHKSTKIWFKIQWNSQLCRVNKCLSAKSCVSNSVSSMFTLKLSLADMLTPVRVCMSNAFTWSHLSTPLFTTNCNYSLFCWHKSFTASIIL